MLAKASIVAINSASVLCTTPPTANDIERFVDDFLVGLAYESIKFIFRACFIKIHSWHSSFRIVIVQSPLTEVLKISDWVQESFLPPSLSCSQYTTVPQ
jgi:hypothetical protein